MMKKRIPSQRTEVIIRMKAVEKIYDGPGAAVHALRGVDLAIEEGTVWAIMGPSGSGKSTLLNLIGCLDTPTGGDYRLAGRDVTQLTDTELSEMRSRHIGFVFQSFHLIPHYTVIENVLLPDRYRRSSGKNRRDAAIELLLHLGLEHRHNHLPRQLSGGEQQRAAIARSLINGPSVLLADEPTGNLDSETTAGILDIFRRLAKEGTTLVMVTHNREVASISDHILWMKDGRLSATP